MGDKVSDSPVRIIGSRELHQNLPGILRELENDKVRYVLTVHGKPRAVLVGAEPYLNMVLEGKGPSEALVGLQLSALLGGNLELDAARRPREGPRQRSRSERPAMPTPSLSASTRRSLARAASASATLAAARRAGSSVAAGCGGTRSRPAGSRSR